MVGEVRLRRLGPTPLDMAKIVLVDENYNPVSFSLFSALSLESRKLAEALCASIENDFLSIISVQESGDGEGTEDEDEDQGVKFG